jgi:hypothetical protein
MDWVCTEAGEYLGRNTEWCGGVMVAAKEVSVTSNLGFNMHDEDVAV